MKRLEYSMLLSMRPSFIVTWRQHDFFDKHLGGVPSSWGQFPVHYNITTKWRMTHLIGFISTRHNSDSLDHPHRLFQSSGSWVLVIYSFPTFIALYLYCLVTWKYGKMEALVTPQPFPWPMTHPSHVLFKWPPFHLNRLAVDICFKYGKTTSVSIKIDTNLGF